MALDLTRLVSQVHGMAARLKARSHERDERLVSAREALDRYGGDAQSLRKKIDASRTTWLVAGIVEGLGGCHRAPALPRDFTVVATDGSHIDVDRHRTARCYLLNIGSVVLRYGSHPAASLGSQPRLYADDEELVVSAPGTGGREQPIEGTLLGIKRTVEECRALARLAADLPGDTPTLALMDGSLLLWGLEPYPEFVTEELLDRGFIAGLEELSRLALQREIVPASYISFPRSTDVVNALRVALCPRETVDSDHCPACDSRECEALAGIRDRDLFGRVLGPGERSDVFMSSSKIQGRYGAHRVHFFYLEADGEVARVEVPGWVALDRDRVGLAHSLVLDQCRRGLGYPVALSEAHEKAVVTGADAAGFWELVERSLADQGLPVMGSAKSRSKRTRWV